MKVKICCHSCRGLGYIIEFKYPKGDEVKVVCPECAGKAYVEEEEYKE